MSSGFSSVGHAAADEMASSADPCTGDGSERSRLGLLDACCMATMRKFEGIEVLRVRSAASVFAQGASAEHLYVVRTGTFKCFRTDEDGYEQVLGFLDCGDVIGFDAIASGCHPCASQALEDSTVYAMGVHHLPRLRQEIARLDAALQHALSRQFMQIGELAHLMAAVAAEVRLARFLLQVSTRMAARGQSPTRLLLRMSRGDIASYLGVAIGTVSRALTALTEWGVVQVHNRDVDILDLDALRACSQGTRRRVNRPQQYRDLVHGSMPACGTRRHICD